MGVFANRAALLPHDFPVAAATPFASFTRFTSHIDDFTVGTSHPSYARVWEVDGLAHDTLDSHVTRRACDDVAALLRALAKGGRTVYSWLIREKVTLEPDLAGFHTTFAKSLARNYYAKLGERDLFSNRWFMGLEDRVAIPGGSLLGPLVQRTDRSLVESRRRVALADLNESAAPLIEASLGNYGVQALRLYQSGVEAPLFSEVMEFVNFLLCGVWSQYPVSHSRLNQGLGRGELFANGEYHELRDNGKSIFTAHLGIREYSGGQTYPTMLDAFLEAPFECVIGHSFSFVPDVAALQSLKQSRRRIRSTDEDSQILVAQLDDAIQLVTARQVTYGEHSMVVQVKSPTLEGLNQAVATARDMALAAGLTLEVEKPTSLAAHMSLLPGNLRFRCRPAFTSQLNAASFMSFHNFPLGKEIGNRWGKALFPVATSAGTVHHFNVHVGETGHFFGQGKTGEGKSVLLALILAFSERADAHWLCVDRDRGMELVVRALGGTYTSLKSGVCSGWNPFDREATQESVSFLVKLMKFCAEQSGPLTLRQMGALESIVQRVMANEPREIRGIRSIYEQCSDRDDERGLYQRIKPWIDGEYSWVFKLSGPGKQFGETRIFAIDPTEILGLSTHLQALLMELWDRFKGFRDARASSQSSVPLGFLGDEVWSFLNIPYFASEIKDLDKTGRKLNAVVGLFTQEGEDLAEAQNHNTLISQTTTQIYLPSDGYRDEPLKRDFSFSERECAIVRDGLPLGSRRAYIRQGGAGVVVSLHIGGLRELAICSGNPDKTVLLESIMKESSEHPDDWLDTFYQRVPSLGKRL